MTQPRLERVGQGTEWAPHFPPPHDRVGLRRRHPAAGRLLLSRHAPVPGPGAGNLAGGDAVRTRRRARRRAAPQRARFRAQRRPAPAGHRGREPRRRRTRHEDRRCALARHRGRLLRRPAAGAPAGGNAPAVARQVRGPAGVREAARRARHLRLPADVGPPEDPGLARRARRHHGLDLLRARPVGVRPDAGALRPDPRHAARRRARIAVPRHGRRAEARQRHRARCGRPAAGCAPARRDRDRRAAILARAGLLQAAPIRPRWPRVPRLQVPHDDRVRGRPADAGDAL